MIENGQLKLGVVMKIPVLSEFSWDDIYDVLKKEEEEEEEISEKSARIEFH